MAVLLSVMQEVPMPSLRARIVEALLPLLGIKKFFSEPDRMDARIARLRAKDPVKPRGKWRKRFDIVESHEDGYTLVTATPKGGAQKGAPHILYLHGGGYIMDIAAVHYDAVFKLCEQLGASASVPLYPLAPETTVAETLPAMRRLYDRLAQRYGAGALHVMGDSAGGGMTLALAQDLMATGGPAPASLVLYSPWLDATGSGEGQAELERKDKMLSLKGLSACASRYGGDVSAGDPRLSPLFGALDGLPPTAIFAGTHDVLLVDGRRLAEKICVDGTQHMYREYEAMPHVWMLLPIPEGKRALQETAQFVARHHRGLAT